MYWYELGHESGVLKGHFKELIGVVAGYVLLDLAYLVHIGVKYREHIIGTKKHDMN